MSRRPKSATVPYMDDLFLLAVATGNRHSDIRLFHLCLVHKRPSADIQARTFSASWMFVRGLLQSNLAATDSSASFPFRKTSATLSSPLDKAICSCFIDRPPFRRNL